MSKKNLYLVHMSPDWLVSKRIIRHVGGVCYHSLYSYHEYGEWNDMSGDAVFRWDERDFVLKKGPYNNLEELKADNFEEFL